MKPTVALLSFFYLFAYGNPVFAQVTGAPIIKGQVVDDITHSPIPGATVSLIGSDPAIAVATDKNGYYLLTRVPVGTQSLRISCTGYEPQLVNEIVVTSGKETILDVLLSEKANVLKEVKISVPGKRATNNGMVTVSGRSFNVDDTKRYPGSLGDPSRMVAGFAGVASANDSRNDIVVRGNSPAGVLWQIEGIDIPNPNHFGSLSSTGGPVTLLNVNNLGKSDFLTGAFPAQYGNASSAVFDLRLRDGNTTKHEFLAQVAFNGYEVGAEGPVGHNGGSYMVNYRYSTLALLHTVGLNLGTGNAIPQYQDLNIKIAVPLSSKNKLSIFGLGGPSSINFLGKDVDTTKDAQINGSENENLYTRYFKAIIGATLETHFNDRTFGKLSLGYSNTSEKVSTDSISTVTQRAFPSNYNRYKTNTFSLVYKLTYKFDARDNLAVGLSNNFYLFDIYSKQLYGGGVTEKINVDQSGNTVLAQGYAEFKHSFSNDLYVNAGVHAQVLALNNAVAVEPRLGLKYKLNDQQSLSMGYGMYSQAQSLLVYFNQLQNGGQSQYSNKNLGFTKSQQFVLGYDHNIGSSLHFKTEVYYQALTNVPVESVSSGYSVLNSGADFGTDHKNNLVNKGTGTNYGMEFTLEKSYTRGTYFLFTTSIFDSKYKGSDGIQRNTAFNTRYVVNLLAGKDFQVGSRKNVLSLNLKLSGIGGKYTSPVDLAASRVNNETKYDEIIAPYSLRQASYFRSDLKIGYRINYAKSTLEFGVDLENITGHKNIFGQTYNRRTNSLNTQYQQGFLQVPYLKYTF